MTASEIETSVPSPSTPLPEETFKASSLSKDNLNSFSSIVPDSTSSYNINKEKPSNSGGIPTPSVKKSICFCILIAMCGFIFGWDVGTIGGITNMYSFKQTFGTIDTNGIKTLPNMLIGVIISIFNVGCAIGGLTLAKISDYRGRKMGMYVALFVYVIGVLVQISIPPGSSGKWYQFLVGRILTGLGVGATSVLGPMFIGETAPLRIRGAMVVMYQLVVTAGILMGGVVNYICKKAYSDTADNHGQWQIPIALGFAWAAIVGLGTFIAPESPVYLANKNKKIDNIDVGLNQKSNWKESFVGKPRYGLRLLIGCAVMIFQQTSGINYFFYYGTSLFDRVGLQDPYLTAIILGAVNFVATFGGLYLVEKLGRKKLLLVGSFGAFVSMMVYASVGSFAFQKHASGGIMIAFTCFFIIFFAIALGPVTFVVVSELYPPRVKTFSMAIATSLNWMSNFLIGLLTPTITARIGYKFGYVFAAFMLASTFFVFFFVPETKNKNSDEIDKMYGKKMNKSSDTENI
ncbi:hypothetical protein ACO0RG_000896 [Hanseniaspora osmophila]